MDAIHTPKVIVVMGVSGSGKSTIGTALAAALGWRFIDADDHHPESNKDKMSRGVPLTDDDRAPWLATLAEIIRSARADEAGLVLACSALRESYRHALRGHRPERDASDPLELENDPDVAFVHLSATREELDKRLRARSDHFMPASLLDSQLATLELPGDALTLSAIESPERLVESIRGAHAL